MRSHPMGKMQSSWSAAAVMAAIGALLVPATGAAYHNLTDPSGMLWDIDDQGTGVAPSTCGSGFILNGTTDAYDNFGFMCVTTAGATLTTKCLAADVYCGVVAPAFEMSNRQLVLGEATLQGLTVQRRVYVADPAGTHPADANSFVRYYDTLHNPTAGAITVQIRYGSAAPGYNNLGSDSSTSCHGTSSGDTIMDTTDLWVTTDDTDGSGDPSLGFLMNGNGASEVIDYVALNPYTSGSSDELMWAFDDVTVPAGGTVAFLTFMIQDSNQTNAQAEATYLATMPMEAIEGLSGEQLTNIRNFAFCDDCDGDGYHLLDGDCNDWNDEVHPGITVDPCDGEDNDCDPATEDGATETWFATPCDGDDDDLCEDGQYLCVDGAQACVDGPEPAPDICDGIDNDCDPATPDGSGDERVGAACDGDDADECAEGIGSCEGGVFVCSDTMDDTPELCDGIDNDCNPSTVDGVEEDWYLAPCDGADADLCEEGQYDCVSGIQVCTDNTGEIREVCNGVDDDCDPSTEDGADETWIGDPCDGADADMCAEGHLACVDGAEYCDDLSADNFESCNGVDDDCNPATSENSDNDGDGISACAGDCNDGDSSIYPGAEEICDGVDQDCDPMTDRDGDGDGYRDCDDDCDDMNPNIHPDAEIDCTNGQDNDCNGIVDSDEPVCAFLSGGDGGCGCALAGRSDGPGILGALAIMGLALAALALRRR